MNNPNHGRTVRIGGASAFWGDSACGPAQLVDVPGMQYITFDYLAELTMSILAAAKAKNPELGYASDFVDGALRSILSRCTERGIRLISNAGGLNPHACAQAVERLAAELGCAVRVAVVDGDDVMALLPALREAGATDFYTGVAMPARMASANAYLGARPIAQALAEGADIVITGRVVDSAVVLGALMHEFGWRDDDFDLLAAGSLAGHIIECGAQATGGLHTDWQSIPDWPEIGYPVLDCRADGSFELSKPQGSGGRVLAAAVCEQMLYEIGDPSCYLLPDVACDFTDVLVSQLDADRVAVRGARGAPPPDSYKVSATYVDGWRCVTALTIVGFDAVAKARRTGEAIVERTRRMFSSSALPDYSGVEINVLGTEEAYGPHARAHDLREAVMRVAVRHPVRQALELFASEIAAAATSWSPGTVGTVAPGRPGVSPLVRLFSFTVPKAMVRPRLQVGAEERPAQQRVKHADAAEPRAASPRAFAPSRYASAMVALATAANQANGIDDDEAEVPLIRLAWARSGDKGDTSNIGVIARRPELLPYLLRELTAERVRAYFAHSVKGDVTRHDVPGIHAVNFVLRRALDGGGMASLRNDPLGKAMGQILLAMPVRVPARLLEA